MIKIDQLAYESKLRFISPNWKFCFSICSIFTINFANSITSSIIGLLIASYLTLKKGQCPFFEYLKWMQIPLFFLILSVLPIIFEFHKNSSNFIFCFPFFNYFLGFTLDTFEKGIHIFFKTLSGISFLYFIIFNTPLWDLVITFKKWHLPNFLIELMLLIYHFIFIMIDKSIALKNAQNSRLGHINFKISIKSMALLFSSVFILSLKRVDFLYNAMESRGYNGEFNFHPTSEFKTPSYFWIFILSFFLISISFF